MKIVTIDDYMSSSPSDQAAAFKAAMGISETYETWKDHNPEKRDRAPGIHASELSGCVRRMVYCVNDTPAVSTVNRMWRNRFMMGHAVHDMLQRDFHRWARGTGLRVQFLDEVRIAPGKQHLADLFNIHSSCDGVFSLRDNQDHEWLRVLLEIKSISDADFAVLREPKLEHIEQAHLYMACLNVPFIWFLYWNKNNQAYTGSHMPGFCIPFDPSVWDGLEQRINQVFHHVGAKTLPDRTEGAICMFCAWAETCRPPSRYKPKSVAAPKHLVALKGRK